VFDALFFHTGDGMHRVFLCRVTVQRRSDAENHALIHDDKSSRYLKQAGLIFARFFTWMATCLLMIR